MHAQPFLFCYCLSRLKNFVSPPRGDQIDIVEQIKNCLAEVAGRLAICVHLARRLIDPQI